MARFRKKYLEHIRKLGDGAKYQAQRRGLDLDNGEVFDTLLNEASEKFAPEPEAENGEAIYERRMLCLSVLNLAIARYSESEDDVIEALCFGNWLNGCLGFVPENRTGGVCPTCIIKNFNSKNGEIGALKRHAPMRDLEKWSVEQYMKKAWPSANKAAHELKDSIVSYGKTIGAELTEQNAQRTIAEWFRRSKKSLPGS